MRMKTLEQCLLDFTVTHGDLYDYSKVDYVGTLVKVEIVCRKHGSFKQTPRDHISGQGCPVCADATSDTNDFVDKSKKVHNGKYDYSKTVYKNAITKVTITCQHHGDFEQRPNSHLRGSGCPKCSDKTSNQQSFAEKSNKVHNGKYNYDQVIYKNTNTKVKIVCKDHGVFEQTPYSHLRGDGCPRCSKSGFKTSKPAVFYIYVGDFVGFGITNNLKTRHKTHKTNFKKHRAEMVLYKTYASDGHSIKHLELSVKSAFADNIIDSGIDGFRTEALPKCFLSILEKFLDTPPQPEV